MVQVIGFLPALRVCLASALKNQLSTQTRIPSVFSSFVGSQHTLLKCNSRGISFCQRRLSPQGNVVPSLFNHENRLELQVARWPHPLNLSYLWLRDHCRCEECYNPKTSQRIFDVQDIPLYIKPMAVKCTDKELSITWPDGHVSKYDFQFLWENSFEGRKNSMKKVRPVTWTKSSFPALELITVPKSEFLGRESGVKKVMDSILKFGVAFVSEVPVNVEATQEIVEAICPPQKTFFGEMWTVHANMQLADTAYSNDFLGAHTDSTYFSEAPRIQVFHCLQAAEGGETLLVDGFSVAEDLKRTSPESYEFLSTSPIPLEYIGDNQHHLCCDPVFKHHSGSGKLKQFRYNIYDRAPLSSLPFHEIRNFYAHYQKLSDIVRRPSNEIWLKLLPGQVLFIDNWRIMHGRNQFLGPRTLTGCYMENSGFTSKARVMGFNID